MNEPSRRTVCKDAVAKPNESWVSTWNMTPHGAVGTARYTHPAFARLGHERLWRRVWQAAARLDEIPEPGDYAVYDIGDQLVLPVRVDSSTVKAYHNVCPHRVKRTPTTGVDARATADRSMSC